MRFRIYVTPVAPAERASFLEKLSRVAQYVSAHPKKGKNSLIIEYKTLRDAETVMQTIRPPKTANWCREENEQPQHGIKLLIKPVPAKCNETDVLEFL